MGKTILIYSSSESGVEEFVDILKRLWEVLNPPEHGLSKTSVFTSNLVQGAIEEFLKVLFGKRNDYESMIKEAKDLRLMLWNELNNIKYNKVLEDYLDSVENDNHWNLYDIHDRSENPRERPNLVIYYDMVFSDTIPFKYDYVIHFKASDEATKQHFNEKFNCNFDVEDVQKQIIKCGEPPENLKIQTILLESNLQKEALKVITELLSQE